MKNIYLAISLVLCCAAAAQGAAVQPAVKGETFYLSLAQVTKDALQNSPALKQAAAKTAAAYAQYKSAQSSLYPALFFDAKGSYVSQVPTLQVGPQSLEFGDKWGYSIGPSLNYTLFDNNQSGKLAQSAYALWQAAQNEEEFTKDNLILQTRQAYFAVQQDLQHIYYAQQQLNVAQKQLADILAANKAGAKSSLDVNMAQKQQLKIMVNISAARAALGGHLRALWRLSGTDYSINAAYPQDARCPADDATAFISADDMLATLSAFNAARDFTFNSAAPQLAALTNNADYYKALALSYSAVLYPRVTLSGGVYWEYPNGPLHEDIINGRASAGLRLPLFEGGKNKQAADAQQKQREAVLYQQQDLSAEMQKIFYTAQSMLFALNAQEQLTQQIIATCVKTAALTYDAYRAGTVTFLEVDNANLSLLEAQTALADIYAKRLNSFAVIENLGRGK